MRKTHHAIIRSQQRGIQNNQLELIMKHGTEVKKPGNVIEFRLLKKDIIKAIEQAHQDYKETLQNIDKCRNKAVLVDLHSGVIITTYILRKQKPNYPDIAA